MVIIKETKLSEGTDLRIIALGLYKSIKDFCKRAIVIIPSQGSSKDAHFDCQVKEFSRGVRFVCEEQNRAITLFEDKLIEGDNVGKARDVSKVISLKLTNNQLLIETDSNLWVTIKFVN